MGGTHVGVGDLEPRHGEADLPRLEALLHGPADGLGDGHEMRGQPGVEVDPVGGFFFRDDERVAGGEGGGAHEGCARVVAPDETSSHPTHEENPLAFDADGRAYGGRRPSG